MRIVLAACAVAALTTGQARAESAPLPQPSSLPASAAEVKASWVYLGLGAGPTYVQPAASLAKGKQIAWDAMLLDPPMEVGGRQILGNYYLREYDCAGRRERVLYWARLADKDVRWNQTRPTPWVVYDLLMGDANVKRFETICGPQEQ